MFGAIANSTSIGGILKLNSEMVDMSDGLFEMMLIRKINNRSELNQAVLSLAKSDYNNKMFDFIHASSFKIKTNSDMTWSLDGEEAAGGNEITVSNLHNAITIYK
jgi:diacylglycerol kinase family enzyme